MDENITNNSTEEFYKKLDEIYNPAEEAALENIEEKETVSEKPEEKEEPQVPTLESNDKPEETQEVDYNNEFDDESDSKSHMIPRTRLNKETQKRRELEEQLRQEREARLKFETELNLYNKAIDKLNKPKEDEFSPIDQKAHEIYLNKIKELEEKLTGDKEEYMRMDNMRRFEYSVNKQAEDMAKSHPDFEDAYSYVLEREREGAKIAGYSNEQADAYALSRLQPIAWDVYNKGGNVAEAIYSLAKNYGFKNKESKSGPKVNHKAIERNSRKTENVTDELNGSGGYNGTMEVKGLSDIRNNLMNENGRGVNTAKFHDALDRIYRNRQNR